MGIVFSKRRAVSSLFDWSVNVIIYNNTQALCVKIAITIFLIREDAENVWMWNFGKEFSVFLFLQPVVKKENKEDLSDLSDCLSKSLTVIEVVSLVKRCPLYDPSSPQIKNGLPNFKKFKKVIFVFFCVNFYRTSEVKIKVMTR